MNKKKGLLLCLIFISVFVPLLFTEIYLRSKGNIPGNIWDYNWYRLDTSAIVDYWIVDSNGICKFNPGIANKLVEECQPGDTFVSAHNVMLYYVILSHHFVRTPLEQNVTENEETFFGHFAHNYAAPFWDMIRDFESGKRKIVDSVDQAYIDWMKQPFNDDGFYSIPFKNYSTTKKKLLLVGGASTFGFSAIPSFNSWACLLSAKGYAVFNAGIPGADPAQYAAIIKQYIKRIKPDAVILGIQPIDVMWSDRPLKPNTGYLLLVNNTQVVKSWTNETYLPNIQEACKYFLTKSSIPNADNSWIKKAASLTVLGTRLWVKYAQYTGQYESTNPFHEELHFWKDSLSYSEKYLLEIDSICKRNGIQFEILSFPNCSDLQSERLKFPPYVFKLISYHKIPNLTAKDYYTLHDGHFNNYGVRKVADLVDSLVNQNNIGTHSLEVK